MATSFCKENIHLIVIVLDCKNVQNRCDDSVKLTFWGYNRLNAILEHFKKPNHGIKNDDTTASSGQSSNSQKNKVKAKSTSKKLPKSRSRRFTAEKRNRTQESQENLEENEEDKSVLEEEKKL